MIHFPKKLVFQSPLTTITSFGLLCLEADEKIEVLNKKRYVYKVHGIK
ncbi:MAG: hypothetical protein JO297_15630 [Nitrososphaeraceae archaeon]|nr:hypothetical protein [Nitrososphaeraceae archaeon]